MTGYPIGYASRLVSLAELERVHGPKMHPEFRARLFPYLTHKGGLLGIGGGWRATQPAKPGFAPEGQSFHQDQVFASGFVGYAAVDLVAVNPGGVHRSPTWAECADAKTFGLHTFISGEPWHMQCVEMRGWRTWVDAGRKDPVANFLQPPDTGDDMATLPEPVRLLDTRPLIQPVQPDQPLTIPVAPGRPAGMSAAILNITVTDTRGPGYLTAWAGGTRPSTSNVNYDGPGQIRSNLAFVKVGANNTVTVSPAGASCHVVVDQQGWAA